MRLRTFRFPRHVEVMALLVVTLIVVAIGPVRAATLDHAMAAVFTVHSATPEDRFLGSAFLWAGGEVAVTNAHVVGDAGTVRLTDAAGRRQIARVIARDAVRDVAVLEVEDGGSGLPLAGSIDIGTPVWALGAPLGLEFSVTAGQVSALARQVEVSVPLRLIQHDAAVNPGSSGGPLVDAAGHLVGMNSRIADGSRMFVGIAYAISTDDLTRIVTGLVDGSLVGYLALDFTGREVDLRIAGALGVPEGTILVDAVGADGPMRDLRAGDVVLAVDGVALTDASDLPFAIEAAQRRGSVEVLVRRARQVVVVEVDLIPDEDLALRGIGEQGFAKKRYTLANLGLTLGDGNAVVGVGAELGIAVGEVLLALNGVATDRAGLEAAVISAPTLLLVRDTDGRTRHVVIDPWAQRGGFRAVGGANVLDPDVVVF
ncbi:MAG: S1C family serine protease [Paracoccaceae bacterium]